MGMLEMPANLPDVHGLPEYHVSEMYTEITGHDVRLAFGDRRFGQTQWLYTVIIDPERLLMLARRCEAIAHEMFAIQEMLRRQNSH